MDDDDTHGRFAKANAFLSKLAKKEKMDAEEEEEEEDIDGEEMRISLSASLTTCKKR